MSGKEAPSGPTATAVVLDQRGVVPALPIPAVGVTVDHLRGTALDGDHVPDLFPMAMPGDRHFLAQQAFGAKGIDSVPDSGVHTGSGLRVGKAFRQDTNAQFGCGPGQLVGEARPVTVAALSRVQSVGPGDHVENQRGIGDRAGHGPKVIQRLFDGECPRVGDQPVRRLVPDDPGERGGQPNRTALIAADGEVDGPGGDQRGAPA